MAKKANPNKGIQPRPGKLPGKQKSISVKNIAKGHSPAWSTWIFFGFAAVIFLQTRIQLLSIPLERDEGSFAYIGHWLLKGQELYTDMLDSKLPGLYTYYAFFTTLFGYNATGVHIGLLVANMASAVCLYLLAKELYNPLVAAIATSFFMFLVISPNLVGFAAHATQLLTPFVLGSFLLFWKGIRSNRTRLFFLSGILMGIAFSIKQQSAIYGILIAVMWWPARLLWYKRENSRLPVLEWLLLGAGGFLPLALIVVYFVLVGRIDEFYNWTVVQPLHLAGSFVQPWYNLFLQILPVVISQFEGIWILAGTGLVFIFISGFKREGPWFATWVALLGMISVTIGAAYYPHYFILAIPGICILAASSLNWIAQKTGKFGTAIALSISGILLIVSMRGRTDYYFYPDFAKIHFENYGRNMFPELEKLGKELAKRAPEGSKIGVMGSEPELLVAAGRESCSRHLMVYALLSDPVLSPPLQQEYIREMQECAPEYIVWNTYTGSWTNGYEKLAFFKQLMPWVEENYRPVGLAESRDDKPGIIVWDEALQNHQSQSDFKVYVLKRVN